MKQFLKNLVWSLGWLMLLVPGGVFLSMVLASAVGYLSYSDRPGPGWYGAHLPTFSEISFYFGFAVYFAFICLLWAIPEFLFVWVLCWLGSPRWLLRILAGLTSGYLCLFLADAAGWYIAIAAFPVYVAGILGIVFGAIILPRYSPRDTAVRPSVYRYAGIPALVILFAAILVYPMLPPRNSQSLEVRVVVLEPGDQPVGPEAKSIGLSDEQIGFLRSAGIHGKLHQDVQLSSTNGNDEKKAKAVVVLTRPIKSPIELRQPKATSVLLLQDGDGWKTYPENSPTLKRKITISRSADDSITLSLDPS